MLCGHVLSHFVLYSLASRCLLHRLVSRRPVATSEYIIHSSRHVVLSLVVCCVVLFLVALSPRLSTSFIRTVVLSLACRSMSFIRSCRLVSRIISFRFSERVIRCTRYCRCRPVLVISLVMSSRCNRPAVQSRFSPSTRCVTLSCIFSFLVCLGHMIVSDCVISSFSSICAWISLLATE